MTSDTIFALSSGQPPAAVSIIRVSGPQSHQAGRLLCGDLPEPRRAALRTLRGSAGELLDEALVLRFDAPASSTGEDIVEFQCHGGRAVVDAVIAALTSLGGLRAAEPGEFTRRAFANGRIDLTEAEGLADLLEAETESQRRAALLTAEGGLRRKVEDWRQRVTDLSARAEAAIDYVGDEEETAADEQALAAAASALADELALWLAQPRAEPLKQGIRVVVAGPPNTGKSSLINAVAQVERAIVTDIPGTTRDVIEVPLSLAGVPLLLVDTAGLRVSDDPVEAIGVARADAQVLAADVLLWLGQPDEAPPHPHCLRVHSRWDLAERRQAPAGTLPVSAITGDGLTALTAAVLRLARAQLPAEGKIALNRRQAAELQAAESALRSARPDDLVLTAEALRLARCALDRLTGRSGVDDMLDALFGRFCLGK